MVRVAVLVSFFFMCGCYEENYPLNILDAPIKYHLFGLLKAGESPTFEIRKALSASSEGTPIDSFYIKTGFGILFENNQVKDTIVFDLEKELFRLQKETIIAAGQSYSIKFFDRGNLQIESEEVTVPSTIPDFQVLLDTNACIQGLGSFRNCELSIRFEEAVDIVWEYLPSPALTNTGFVEFGDQSNLCDRLSYRVYQILPKQCLESGITKYFLPFRLSESRADVLYYDHYRISLSVVSESYWRYLIDLAKQDNYSVQLFVEPTITYTNMIKGLGVLGAAKDTVIDVLER